MKALWFMAAFLLAVVVRADVATSADYAITAEAFDGGGARSVSADYVQDIAITDLAGRSLTVSSNVITFGLISQLNGPPTALDDLRSHPQNEPVTIPIAALLVNDFDLENDPLSLLSWDATTLRGGSVAKAGASLLYTPPADLVQEDQFNYTVIDSSGDIDVGAVRLVIAPSSGPQPLNTVALYPLSNGTYLLRFKNDSVGSEFHVQFKELIDDPEWELITVSHAPDGIVEIIIDPTQAPQGYYRVRVF